MKKSTVLTALSLIGVGTTVYFTIKDTTKAVKMLDEAKKKKGEALTKKEILKTAAPCYISTAVSVVGTGMCILGTATLNKKEQASLVSAYALMEKQFNAYRAKVIELQGEEFDEEVRMSMARHNAEYHTIGWDEADDRKLTWYEPISQTTFDAYEREVMDAEYHINRNYILGGFISVNSYLEFFGIDPVPNGDKMGWDYSSGIMWLDFEHSIPIRNRVGKDIYHINCLFSPDEDYTDLW